MIEVRNLVKDYANRRAIDNLTFDAVEGEVLGFLGPNGAGKTTTMRILSGFMPPTSGQVRIAGYDVLDNSLEVRRIVGYLPETVPLYNDMTVREYLRYMGDLRHLNNLSSRTNEVLEMVGMDKRARGYIGKLSKGMRQRVGLAQALLHDPRVLILDEPTIGLDPGQVVKFRDLIKDLGKQRTILLSSHILPEVQQVCDRVLIINKGKIVAEDTPLQLQARLSGSQRVLIEIGQDASETVDALRGIEGITSIEVQSPTVFTYESLPGLDCRAEVARHLVSQGFSLLRMEPLNLSLEEIFLQLTREDTTVPTLPVVDQTGNDLDELEEREIEEADNA